MTGEPPDKAQPIHIHLRGDDSDGHLALIEMTFAVGDTGPPLHLHPGHGEGFYVLSGEMTFRVGEETTVGAAGEFAWAAAGVPHTLGNLSKREARVLVLCGPAGFERYFERLPAGQHGPPEADAVRVGPSFGEQAPEVGR